MKMERVCKDLSKSERCPRLIHIGGILHSEGAANTLGPQIHVANAWALVNVRQSLPAPSSPSLSCTQDSSEGRGRPGQPSTGTSPSVPRQSPVTEDDHGRRISGNVYTLPTDDSGLRLDEELATPLSPHSVIPTPYRAATCSIGWPSQSRS